MWILKNMWRAQHVQNPRKKTYNGSKKFHHTTGVGGPFGGSQHCDPPPQQPQPDLKHGQQPSLDEKNEKNTYNSGVGLQPSPPALQHMGGQSDMGSNIDDNFFGMGSNVVDDIWQWIRNLGTKHGGWRRMQGLLLKFWWTLGQGTQKALPHPWRAYRLPNKEHERLARLG